MAETKRKFYNTGDAKGFTKKKFFETVVAILNEEDVDQKDIDLTLAAAEYELEGIALRPSTAGTGEKKNPLDSEYAVAMRAAILPLLTQTPQNANEIINAATAKGLLSPKGTPFATSWVGRILKPLAEAGEGVVRYEAETFTTTEGAKAQLPVRWALA